MKRYETTPWLEPYEEDDEPLLPARFAAFLKSEKSEQIHHGDKDAWW